MVVEKRRDDAGAELGAQVEREVRQAHPVRERTRVADRLRRAAGALAVVLLVGPQLERDGDRVAAVAAGQQRDDRAVDAAGHRHQRPLLARGRRQRGLRADRRPERPRERVGDQLGGVELAGGEPAELPGEVVGAESRGVEQLHPSTSSAVALSAATVAPQASASQPTTPTRRPSASSASESRTTSPHSLVPATPSAAPAGARPARGGEVRWCSNSSRSTVERV